MRNLRNATVVRKLGVTATLGLALAVTASSCSIGNATEPTTASKDSAQRTNNSTPEQSPNVVTGQEALVWSTCSEDVAAAAGLECSVLQVPIDSAKPNGPTTELALIRQKSTGTTQQRIGSLVINPGGPGGSGIEFLTAAAGAFPSDLTDSFDLVSFDPRGVAASSPVRCEEDAALEKQLVGDLSPDTAEELNKAVAEQKAFLAACRENSTELLTHMSTADVAADLDQL
ncbi:MAG: hypothetical protein WD029_08870, partial [Microthrixaceae bacterium]